MDKRTFLKKSGMAATVGLVEWGPLGPLLDYAAGRDAMMLAKDEDFWAQVRAGYKLKPDYINFENGYYCFLPEEILERQIAHMRDVNLHGSQYMRTRQFPDKDKMASRLAETFGCKPTEMVITRNTTESLDLVIQGRNWQPGDEAVMANQDYGAMLDMFDLMALRHGMVCKRVDVPLHPATDEEILEVYARAITPKTKLLMVCHMINITGHILPVRKIADMAHARGVEVMVDGAHAIAHFSFRLDELGCDYYGASLHKWLSVPLGAGLLYVREEKIPGLWPLLGTSVKDLKDIKRLNHTGTHPVHVVMSVGDSLDFYQKLGPEHKEARLRHLGHNLRTAAKSIPDVVVNTPIEAERSCGITNIGHLRHTPAELGAQLLQKHGIYTVPIDYAGVHGVRITPNVYTSIEDVQKVIEALARL